MAKKLIVAIIVTVFLAFAIAPRANVIVAAGPNCYGITNGHATITRVYKEGVLRVFNVSFDGYTDWVRTTRFPKPGNRITFNGAICHGYLDVYRWWYGTTGVTKVGK